MRVGFRFQVRRAEIAAAFARKSEAAQQEVAEIIQQSGLRMHAMAGELCAEDTGYMKSHLGLAYSADGGTYQSEVGWTEADFVAGTHPRTKAHPPFYPPFVEFGTSRNAAQPAVTPAFEAEAPRVRTEIAAALARAMATE